MAGTREIIVIGAATSAGAHYAGQEQAPQALRVAGLVRRLEAAGLKVTDLGDVVRETFAVDRSGAPSRNEAAVVRVAGTVAGAVARAAATAPDAVLLVLGGDCTVTLGVLAGLQRVAPDTGVAYFDGDADLAGPGRGSGIMDATGLSHLLGRVETGLSGLFAGRPPIEPGRLAVLGYDETDPDSFVPGVFDAVPGLTHFSGPAVRADPAGCARAAVAATAAADRLLVHFDVDSVDSADLPLANYPHYGTGVSLEAAAQVLSVLFAAPRLSAAVLTEVNPGHDPQGDSLDRYLDAVAGALVSGLLG